MSDERLGTSDRGYTFIEQIGSGGFGTVYRVTDSHDNSVALKVLLADVARTPQGLARFTREVETVRSISHPGCVEIFDVGVLSDGSAFFTMELLQGEDLASRIEHAGALSPALAMDILEPICGVLELLHREGQLHRDIKAQNVFLCEEGRVVLLDFGIAKYFDRQGMTLTHSRELVGTPCAMTPEQLLGASLGPYTDVYALGALTFYMLTGALAFQSESMTVMQQLHQHAARQRPSSVVAVSAAIDRVVIRAMSIDARKRPRDAAAFLDEFDCAVQDDKSPAERSQDGCAVFATLGPVGDNEQQAIAAMDALDKALRGLSALGFELASMQSRGMLCVRPGLRAAGPQGEEEALAELRRNFESEAPAGSSMFIKQGPLRMAGGVFTGGDALVPVRAAQGSA